MKRCVSLSTLVAFLLVVANVLAQSPQRVIIDTDPGIDEAPSNDNNGVVLSDL